VKEEWVELTDGNRKIVMPRRELTNLAQRISRIFANAKPIFVDIDARPTGKCVAVESIFTATILRSPDKHTGGEDGTTPKGLGVGDKCRPQKKGST